MYFKSHVDIIENGSFTHLSLLHLCISLPWYSSSCRVTTHCSSTGRHSLSQLHCIPLNLQSYNPEAA